MRDESDSAEDIHRTLQFALSVLILFCVLVGIVGNVEWMLWAACGMVSLTLILWVVAMTRRRTGARIPTWFMPVPPGWHYRFYVEDKPVLGLDSHEPTVASGQGATLLAQYEDDVDYLVYVSCTFTWASGIVPVDDESGETTVTVCIGLDGQMPVEQTEQWMAVRWHGSGDTWVAPPTVGASLRLSESMNDSDLLEIRVGGSEPARAVFDISGYRQLVAGLAGVREARYNTSSVLERQE
ncbi:MAG: hypothetical protein F4Y49_02965 [Dehalococcoidia bacterium]|nr:hypothetical protein [Dehalococcoidia bacterium]